MSAAPVIARDLATHARQSLGASHAAIYGMVAAALAGRDVRGDRFVDVGCGAGRLWPFIRGRFGHYVGVDGARYDGFPDDGEFHQVDLDGVEPLPLADSSADVVAAVETIEHLENPRAFVRALVRVAKPGGWVVLTTPNQRSLTSILSLVVKGQFSAFQDGSYPAHITALLDVDLRRIGREAGLVEADIEYSRHGRVPLTRWHYPRAVAGLSPHWMSDNLLYIGRQSSG